MLAACVVVSLAMVFSARAGDDACGVTNGVPGVTATNSAGTNAVALNPFWLSGDAPTNHAQYADFDLAGPAVTNRFENDGIFRTSFPYRTSAVIEAGVFHARGYCPETGRWNESGYYQGVAVGVERDISPNLTLGLVVGAGNTEFRSR